MALELCTSTKSLQDEADLMAETLALVFETLLHDTPEQRAARSPAFWEALAQL